ncbi:MAG TPA: TlpA disulfide reductase family protein [Albitalea sp.]|nr:TlpA disulfide reductase family protein [Albitalea sp.]
MAAAGAGIGWSLLRARAASDAPDPSFWQMRFEQPGGGTLAMASMRGQPLLVNFWATWCAPCVREMPMLDRFHRQRHAAGWRVVGLAIDGAAPVQEFLTKLPVGFPIGLAGIEGIELARSLGNHAGALPFTVLFDRSGRIVERKLGALEPAQLDRWGRQITPSA